MVKEISKEKLLDRIEQAAHDYEARYHGCSQCVLKALQEHLKIGNEDTFKSMSGLAGGVGLRGDSCGALLAGIVALGLVFGRWDITNSGQLQSSMMPVRRLYRNFQKEFGSCICRDIQTSKLGRFYDIAKEDEYNAFQEAGGYTECPKVVGKAARMAAELILEEKGGV